MNLNDELDIDSVVSSKFKFKKWILIAFCLVRIAIAIWLGVTEIQHVKELLDSAIPGEDYQGRYVITILFSVVTIVLMLVALCGALRHDYALLTAFAAVSFLVLFIDISMTIFYNKLFAIGLALTIVIMLNNIWLNGDLEDILKLRRKHALKESKPIKQY